jgi:hypothetical protein
MSKLPAFQFYPGDWMKDPALRSCASAARGLWMDMLCLMSEVGHRGYLQTPAGRPVSVEQLARMVGSTPVEVRDLLIELEDAGVFSRTADGVIYSRRMVRDEGKRQRAKEFGQRGGNPTLRAGGGVKGGVNPPQVSGAKKLAKPNLTPSSSSSSSSSPSGEDPPNPPRPGGTVKAAPPEMPAVPTELSTPAFAAAWAEWEQHRRAKGGKLTPLAATKQLGFLAGLGPARAVAAIEHSIRQNYTGIFEANDGNRAAGPGSDLDRRGRAVAEPGKYAHLDEGTWVPPAPGPEGPGPFGKARDPPGAGRGDAGAA